MQNSDWLLEIESERQKSPRNFFATRFHKNVKGEPLDLKSSPFLQQIYADTAQRLVVRKAVQIGISEMLICDALAMADDGLRVFYVLPTIDLRNVFVRDRVNRVIVTVPYYRSQSGKEMRKLEGVPDADSIGLKTFGVKGILLFVGSNSPVSFLSFPADMVIVDEYDKCDKKNLPMADDRLSASEHKLKRVVSTPTVEDFGIDAEYKESCQFRWLVKCEHCGKSFEPDFFKCVVREIGDRKYELVDQDWSVDSGRDIFTICPYCHRPFDRLQQGEWVADNPKNPVSGYSISQLFSHRVSVAEIWDSFLKSLANEYKKQRFYNSILGEAYTSTGAKLTKAMLDECVKLGQLYNLPSRAENTTMGVDVGNVLHVVIYDHPENYRRLVFAGTVPNFDDLHALISRYGVRVACVDYEPERREARRFQESANCHVWLCDYVPNAYGAEKQIDYESKFIKADRTQVMDGFVGDITSQVLLLPANASTLEDEEFYAHLCSPTRVQDEFTGQYTWVNSKPDHYFHAGVYERIANEFFVEPGLSELYAQDKKKQPFPHKKLKKVTR